MNTREHLRQEIIDTQNAFHALLEAIPDEAFTLPSDNPAWTVGQVLYHMSIAPRMMVLDVQMIGGQRWIYRLIPIIMPKKVFDWLNARLTRYGARRLSRQFLRHEYDRANDAILQVLDSLSEEDFSRSQPYPDWDPLLSGEVSMKYLFGYIKRHFNSHKVQIQSAIRKENESS